MLKQMNHTPHKNVASVESLKNQTENTEVYMFAKTAATF